jgi:hypothetical protein
VAWINAPAPTLTRTSGGILPQDPTPCTITTVTVTAVPLVQTTQIDCNILLYANIFGSSAMGFRITATARNVAMSLKQFDKTVTMAGVDTNGRSVSGTLNGAGRAAVTFDGSSPTGSGVIVGGGLCGLSGLAAIFNVCYSRTISIPITLLADHPIVDANDSTYGWFARNKWYELAYYAVAQRHTANTFPPPGCTTGTNCISVANVVPAGGQRAILILAGRPVNGSARPSAALSDYLEFGNAAGAYEKQTVSLVTATPSTDVGTANAYDIPSITSVSTRVPIHFKAMNTNTGPSSLNLLPTGMKMIVNPNGTTLSAGQIRANSVVQINYDGTNFVLLKKPFNDRIAVLDSN